MEQGGKLFESKPGRIASWLLIAVAAAGVALGADAFVVEPQLTLTVSRVDLAAAAGGRLTSALDGARVVHLSDLHIQTMGHRERRLARRLASLRPDLLLLTGDYGEGRDGLEALTRTLEAAAPRLGAWAVLGNNDHQRGERDAIVAALERAGVTVLVNAHGVARGDGGPIAIAGVDDPHYGRDDIAATMAGVPDGMPVILLAHSPDVLSRRARGLMVNAADARGPWKRGWFWQDGAHQRDDPGEVVFPSGGRRRMRIQAREDGVTFDEIRLVPAGTDPPARRGRKGMPAPRRVPGEIVIRAARVSDEEIHGGWTRARVEGIDVLTHTPDRGLVQSHARIDPASYVESGFDARGGERYHVWVHLWSSNTQGTSDSLYLQFTDSLDTEGEPDYRIGVEIPGVPTDRIDLMLAGHQHGGQVRLPWYGPLELNVRSNPWQHGLYRVGRMPLYVSRGTGWSALPVRFWCPPEIVVLDSEGAGENAGTF